MTSNTFITRIYSYPIVQYASDTAKGYYDSAKQSNNLVKSSLETVEQYSQQILNKAEEYSQQPPVDSILNTIDTYGCKQLDKIENGSNQIKKVYEGIKPKTLQSLDSAANKIHGTSLESGLLKTIVFVDTVVDSLFPASESTEDNKITDGEAETEGEKEKEKEDEKEVTSNNKNVVEASAPVINKLLERVTPYSLLLLPSRSYNLSRDLLFQAESVPQINYCIGVLTTSAQKIKQGAALTKDSVDHIYGSLNHVVGLAGKVVQLMARLDAVEAKASVSELVAMIQASKAQFTQNVEQDYEGWKKDIATILQKTGELLAAQAALGYDKVQHSNHAAIRSSVQAIQVIVNGIVERFGPATAPAPTPAPAPANSENPSD